MATKRKNRRTLFQVEIEDKIPISSHKVVYKDDAFWIEINNPFGEYCFKRVTNKTNDLYDFIFPEIDILAEDFFEVFEDERKSIEVLYGENK